MTTDEERNSVLIDLRSAINRIEGQAKSLMTYLDRLPVSLAETECFRLAVILLDVRRASEHLDQVDAIPLRDPLKAPAAEDDWDSVEDEEKRKADRATPPPSSTSNWWDVDPTF